LYSSAALRNEELHDSSTFPTEQTPETTRSLTQSVT